VEARPAVQPRGQHGRDTGPGERPRLLERGRDLAAHRDTRGEGPAAGTKIEPIHRNVVPEVAAILVTACQMRRSVARQACSRTGWRLVREIDGAGVGAFEQM
jgi:hypothetical protein